MAWVRIDDSFDDNPKLYGASGNAIALWLRGLAWCNRTESDGLIPATMLTRIGDHAPQSARAKVAADLVTRRLWHTFGHACTSCEQPEPDGWVVHDFLGYQPSSKRRESEREAARTRMAKARAELQRSDDVPAKFGERSGEHSRSSEDVRSTPTRASRPHPYRSAPDRTGPALPAPAEPSSSSGEAGRANGQDEDEDPPDGSGQPHVPPSTPAAITVAASLNGTSARAWLHGTDERGGLTAGEWTKSALRTLTTQAISDELPADSWPPWAGQVLGEHVAECSRREVTATKVGQLRTLCARHDALSVLEALEVALTDTAVRDHVAYARKCLTA